MAAPRPRLPRCSPTSCSRACTGAMATRRRREEQLQSRTRWGGRGGSVLSVQRAAECGGLAAAAPQCNRLPVPRPPAAQARLLPMVLRGMVPPRPGGRQLLREEEGVGLLRCLLRPEPLLNGGQLGEFYESLKVRSGGA